ncbi:MAG: hypothetical protein KA354_22900 [Phycisphaerae bacterium]|nr:hypothetical protein [Phycisphaerae bacterium]
MQAMQAKTEARVMVALELLRAHAGVSMFKLASLLKDQLGISRRSAQNVLVRARALLSEEHVDTIRDIASSLPGRYADLLARCREAGDLKAEVRALAGAAALCGNVELAETAATPSIIKFVAVKEDADRNLVREDGQPCEPDALCREIGTEGAPEDGQRVRTQGNAFCGQA